MRRIPEATKPSRDIEENVDGLMRDVAVLREELGDDESDIEYEYAANIVQYLYNVHLSKALLECREAIELAEYHVDDFKKIADRIVAILDMPRYHQKRF